MFVFKYYIMLQGCATESGCEGDTISVGSHGEAIIFFTDSENPVVAIHIGR